MPDSATQVIESSSGNTAKALGSLLSPREIPLHIVTNRIRIPEVRNLLQILGVHLEELPPGSDCPDPSDPQSPFEMIRKRVGADDDLYWTEQYKNRENPKIHTETLGPEILEEIPDLGFYFSGLGTTGSSRGIAEYARSIHSPLKNIGIITAGG